MKNNKLLGASFRDPSGSLFLEGGTLLRQINLSYKENYDKLIQSGFYSKLVEENLLVSHQEVSAEKAYSTDVYKVIQPEFIEYISYPYEWCFSQLKDAALATIKIQLLALEYGMCLKDASAYNIQFYQGRPILIDTLSFERYQQGKPWVAYRQFCQHFFAPLALMSYKDIRLNQLLRTNIDGVPLDLASKLLPWRSKLHFSLLTHIHLHARSQQRYANIGIEKEGQVKATKVSLQGLKGIVLNLESAVRSLHLNRVQTEWGDYYSDTNYGATSMQQKKELVAEFIDAISPAPTLVQDIGANTGVFSRVAAQPNRLVISQDIDAIAVEKNYLHCVNKQEKNILPLLLDLTNPSPALGWANKERTSLMQRGPVNAVLALALIHHLAISNNVPLDRLASFFYDLCEHLIIEFIPKSDSQVRRLLATREDIFPYYNQACFEKHFSSYFSTLKRMPIEGGDRVMYLMKRIEQRN